MTITRPVAAWAGPVLWLTVTPALLAQPAKDQSSILTAEDVVALVELRDKRLTTYEATLSFKQGPGKDYDRHLAARQLSARAMAKAMNVPVPQGKERNPKDSPAVVEQTLRHSLGEKRDEKFVVDQAQKDRDGVVFNTTQTFVLEGGSWKTLLGNAGSIQHGQGFRKPGFYTGIDFDWEYPGLEYKERRIGEVLRHALRDGRLAGQAAVVSDGGRRAVELTARFPTSNTQLNDTGARIEYVIRFDPSYGMAPVSFRTTTVQPVGDRFEPVKVAASRAGVWDGYHEVGAVWLPRRFLLTQSQPVILPKEGTEFPAGVGLDKALELARSEAFEVSRVDVEVKSVTANQALPADRFAFEFPKGTLVYDETKDKSYQVGVLNPEIEQQLKGSLQQHQPGPSAVVSPPTRGWRLWLLVFNACAVLVVLAWAVGHRVLRKSDPAPPDPPPVAPPG